MNKKLCSLFLGLCVTFSSSFGVLAANQPVDEVTCTTTQGGVYNQLEQTVLQGIGRDGSVVWTYDTGMKERGNDSNVYWYGQSGNLFFLNYKGSLQAFDITSGDLVWSTPEGDYSFAAGFFDSSGNLCMVNKNGPIVLLNRSGNILARYNTDRMYSSLILSSASMTNNKLIIKYAAKGFGADTQAFNDYNTMPSLSVDLSDFQSKIKIDIDGTSIDSDVPPFLQQDRTFVPVRAIFEGLGAQVSWDAESKTVTAQKDDTTVSLVIGQKEITVNGTVKTLDVSSQIIENRTMVPARAVSEAFGYDVSWNGTKQTVSVITKTGQPEFSVDTSVFSYLGQTYASLCSQFGTVSKTDWLNGPIVQLENAPVFFAFGNGEWYYQESQTIADDELCNCVLTTANVLGVTENADPAAVFREASVSDKGTDQDGNKWFLADYPEQRVYIYVDHNNQVTPNSRIEITNKYY